MRSVTFSSLWPYGLEAARLLCPWNFPGKNTEVGCQNTGGPTPGDLSDPVIELASLASLALAGRFFRQEYWSELLFHCNPYLWKDLSFIQLFSHILSFLSLTPVL